MPPGGLFPLWEGQRSTPFPGGSLMENTGGGRWVVSGSGSLWASPSWSGTLVSPWEWVPEGNPQVPWTLKEGWGRLLTLPQETPSHTVGPPILAMKPGGSREVGELRTTLRATGGPFGESDSDSRCQSPWGCPCHALAALHHQGGSPSKEVSPPPGLSGKLLGQRWHWVLRSSWCVGSVWTPGGLPHPQTFIHLPVDSSVQASTPLAGPVSPLSSAEWDSPSACEQGHPGGSSGTGNAGGETGFLFGAKGQCSSSWESTPQAGPAFRL